MSASAAPIASPPPLPMAVELLQSLADELAEYGVTSVWIFGSVARGEEGPGSDLDISIAAGERQDFITRGDVRRLVARHAGCSVDVIAYPLPKPAAWEATDDLVRAY